MSSSICLMAVLPFVPSLIGANAPVRVAFPRRPDLDPRCASPCRERVSRRVGTCWAGTERTDAETTDLEVVVALRKHSRRCGSLWLESAASQLVDQWCRGTGTPHRMPLY